MGKSRLYYQTSYIKSFVYTVEHCEESGKGAWLVILNQTGSYPEGGGQSHGIETLGGILVLSVHGREGQVIHELAQPIEEGTLAEGITDWQRRYNNMQPYTGEHILSSLVHRHFGYDNMGFHMGTGEATVDFSSVIEPEELERLEGGVNQLVYANAPMKVLCPTEEEPRIMEYKSRKELSGLVHIVEVPGRDVCARCGTHIENAGEVGIIKIRSMIHYKGGVHLSMLCGRRALLDYRDRLKDEIGVSNLLSAELIQVPDTVERLKNDCQNKDLLIGRLGGSLMALKAGQLLESADPLIVSEEDLTPVQVRQYVTLLYEKNRTGMAAAYFGDDRGDEYHYALDSNRMDMRALNKVLNSRLSDRDGSSSFIIQGTFRARRETIEATFREETE